MALVDLLGMVVAAVFVLLTLSLGAWYGGKRLLRSTSAARRGRRSKKVVGLLAILLFVGALLAGAYAVASAAPVDTSAYPLLDLVATVVSSPWTYVVVGLVVLRRILFFRRKRYARQAATTTSMDQRSIRQLAAEARSPDGAARVIATADDSREEIADRIREALVTGDDDSLTPAASRAEVEADLYRAEERALAVADQLDLPVRGHEDSCFQWVGDRGSDGDRDALRDTDDIFDAGDHGLRSSIKHLRLDLAAGLNFSNIAWQFGLPAVVASVVLLAALGLWTSPPWYAVVLLLGSSVGALNYYRHRRRETRRLDRLRDDPESNDWSMISLLVKGVETDETSAYYGWLAGHRYASYDRDRFVHDLAERAGQKLSRGWVAPSVMEKNAEQLADYYPDLAGFRDRERAEIQIELMDRLRSSRYGILPKQQLVEEMVEHRWQHRAGGVYRAGLGYDPELVREAYRDIATGYLAELTLTVETATGTERLVAVESAVDAVPVDRAEIRADFSSLFSEYATRPPRYELPEAPATETPPRPLETRDADEVSASVGRPALADGGDP